MIVSASYSCHRCHPGTHTWHTWLPVLRVTAAALLWTAPELLRIPRAIRKSEGSFSADVFSYGIIVYEICYLTQPYGDRLTKFGAPGNTKLSRCLHVRVFIMFVNFSPQALHCCNGVVCSNSKQFITASVCTEV